MRSVAFVLALSDQATFWLFALLGTGAAGWSLYRAKRAFEQQRTGSGIGWLLFTPVAFVLGFFAVILIVGALFLLFLSLFIGKGNVIDTRWGQKVGDIKNSWGGKEGEIRRGNLGNLEVFDKTGRKEGEIRPHLFGDGADTTNNWGRKEGEIRPHVFGRGADITTVGGGKEGEIRPKPFGGDADITERGGGKEGEWSASGMAATREQSFREMTGRKPKKPKKSGVAGPK